MYLHSPSLDVYHEHQVSDELLSSHSNNNEGVNITITVSRRRFCPACGAKGYKHENIFGDDCPLRGPCVTCAGACKVLVLASTQLDENNNNSSQNDASNSANNNKKQGFSRRNRGRDEEEDDDEQKQEEDEDDQPQEMISMKCRTCKGTGKQLTKEDHCDICRGLETVDIKNSYEIFVPPQSMTSIAGENFFFEGEGNQQRRIQSDEKLSGNLYIYLDSDHHCQSRTMSHQQRCKRVPELVSKGDKLFQAKLYKPALVAYSLAIELDSQCYGGFAGRAATYLKLKNFEKATADAELAADINDMCYKSFAVLGAAYEGSGLLTLALEKYEKAKFLASDPESGDEMTATIESLRERIRSEEEKRIPFQGKSPFAGADNGLQQPRPKQPGSNNNNYNDNNNNNQHHLSQAFHRQTSPHSHHANQNVSSSNNNTRQFTSTFNWAAHQSIGAHNNNHNHGTRNPLDLFLTYDVFADELRSGCVKQVSVVRGTLCTGCMGSGKISIGDSTTTTTTNNNKNSGSSRDKDEDMLLTTLSQDASLSDIQNNNNMMMMMTATTTSPKKEQEQNMTSLSCPVCSGHGIISDAKKFPITINPGTPVGFKFEFPNEGNQSKNNNINSNKNARGNLTIRLGLRPPAFTYNNNNNNIYNGRNNFNMVYAPPTKTFTSAAVAQNLQQLHQWGGNLYELKNKNNTQYYAAGGDDDDEDEDGDSTDEEEERAAMRVDQKTQWLRDLATKHGHELTPNVLFTVAVSNQITAATFCLMSKSDIDALCLPMGPKLALNDILKKEKGE